VSALLELDATALASAVARGEVSAREAAEAALDAAARLDGQLSAFLALDREGALARADAVDRARAAGEALGPLAGVPVALKANLCLAGAEASCASRILAGYRPPYTATCVQRLLDAGANPIGSTNMDEFAMGSSSENSAHGPTRNPWNVARTPGGSSSGSAAAVAARIVPLALGSDTGGSVRQPAALCGIAGFKPTWGRISRYGLIAFASSLDQVSPLARSVRDLELATHLLSGADPLDATCLDEPRLSAEEGGVRGLRVGVPREHFPASLHGEVRARCEEALEVLRGLGAELVPVSLPHTRYAIPTYYVVATAEASSNLARYDGVRYGLRAEGGGSLDGMYAATRERGFGAEVKRRILLGTYVLSAGYHDAWYGRALAVRARIRRDFEAAFAEVDVLAGPTAPEPAFRLGERAQDPLAMYLSDVLTVPASLAGLPGVSVPCGTARHEGARLPVGLQLTGPWRADARVLRVARAYEAATTHHRERPPLAACA
jgi:aspartyl-tRNA(Asn)/glutamyl-tRNA(Gln) amidotransferase subunit A